MSIYGCIKINKIAKYLKHVYICEYLFLLFIHHIIELSDLYCY